MQELDNMESVKYLSLLMSVFILFATLYLIYMYKQMLRGKITNNCLPEICTAKWNKK